MLITIAIEGQHHQYRAYLANVPSAAQLFTRLQYGSIIDGERNAIEKDLKAIREASQVAFLPFDSDAVIIINRKVYKLPAIDAKASGFWDIKEQYGEILTDAARAQLEKQIKPAVDIFCTESFEVLREQTLREYRENLHKTAEYVNAQIAMMQQVVDELSGV